MGFRIDGLYTLRCYRAGFIYGWTFFFCFSQCLSHHLTDDLNFEKVCYLCWKKKNEIQSPKFNVRDTWWYFTVKSERSHDCLDGCYFACLTIYSSGCKFMTLQEGLGSLVFEHILGNTLEGNLKISFVVVVCYCIITLTN